MNRIAEEALARARERQGRRSFWSPTEDAELTELYPDTPMPEIEKRLGRSVSSIYQRARTLGLKRSTEYLATEHAGRLKKGHQAGKPTQFVKGQKPWNTGQKGWTAGGRSGETRFKPGTLNGTAAEKLKPVGFERVTDDGILQRKIRDDGPPHKRWKAVHAILWEETHGPIPAGHLVVFRDRNRKNIQLDNLELITRAENCRRNSIHRYPPELKELIRLQKKLEREIRRQADEESDGRSA
ncbi:HNH endonuclease signature motif containing protein [Pseudomonas sp. LRF_L74]|uniref:HNH endonuclease signature motif containing protein n=1 Tax=Pseudomonas sp. LRF_L74 TaxID=3369422 RepID=UPI003F6387DB